LRALGMRGDLAEDRRIARECALLGSPRSP
jgi:hypothetical protein